MSFIVLGLIIFKLLFQRLEETTEGMFYLSSAINGIELSAIDRKLRATAETSTQKWEVFTPLFERNTWYFIEITWSPSSGLKMYANGMLLKQDTSPRGKVK